MSTDNEKLFLAIINNNSVVTSINWEGVANALGLESLDNLTVLRKDRVASRQQRATPLADNLTTR